jgi:phosphatidylserine decarboxylase
VAAVAGIVASCVICRPARRWAAGVENEEGAVSRTFNAWRTGLPYYGPLLAAGVLLLVAVPFPWKWMTAVPVLGLGLFTLAFFRDPRRIPPGDGHDIVSPADGTVVGVDMLEDSPYYDGPCKRVSIFLSVFNVHVNRAPTAGTITRIAYKEGEFANAMRADSSTRNESNAIYMDTAHGPMVIRQISGAVARRIVCACAEGDGVDKGARLGMIKFGSRTELFLPPAADIAVSMKQKVRGCATIVARMPGEAPDA